MAVEFVRPEVLAGLRRWSEVIAALAVAALGLRIALQPGVVVQGFGWVLVFGGLMAVIPAVRRARFAATGEDPGVVSVDERRVIYMGPTHGGAVALDDLEALSLRREDNGRAAWVLVEGTQLLVIPVDASGADALFDAFTALPGLTPHRVLSARDSAKVGTKRLWSRSGAQNDAQDWIEHRGLPPG